MNLSFAGCGFLGIYHVGVAVCFKKFAPHLLLDKISGASAGALAATCLLCDMPLGEMTSYFFRVVREARSHSLKAFSPSFNIQTSLLQGLNKFLPDNAHELVNGRLHISLTRSSDRSNVILSHFNSREELLQALMCACWIPLFSGFLPPKFQGQRYMDGAFSDNLPVLDENTIMVSPFCGESDICPRDESSQIFHLNMVNTSIEVSMENLTRFRSILIPPKPEELSKMCQSGFNDALKFLQRNNLINCARCLNIQSSFALDGKPFALQPTVPQNTQDFDPECKACVKHRKDVLTSNHMPETVLTVFRTYIDQANKGLANWIFKYRGIKLLHTLSLPATVPADFIFATLTKLLASTPHIRDHFLKFSKFIIEQIQLLISTERSREEMTANITCEISLTECGSQESKPVTTHRSSKLDITIKENEITSTIEHGNERPESRTSHYSGTSTSTVSITGDVDAFEHMLQVTAQQESAYAYYYMDENQKVNVNVRELFNVTDNEDPELQTDAEISLNQQLQYDNNLEATSPDFMYGEEADDESYNNSYSNCLTPTRTNYNRHYQMPIYHPRPHGDGPANDIIGDHLINLDDVLRDDDIEYELFSQNTYASPAPSSSTAFSKFNNNATTLNNFTSTPWPQSDDGLDDTMDSGSVEENDRDNDSPNDSSEPEVDQLHSIQLSDSASRALARPFQSIY